MIQRGNNRQDIFHAPRDYEVFLRWLAEAIGAHRLALHAYVLMTNHVHLLATPLESNSIGMVMQTLGRRYVQYFNLRYNRTGTLFEGRYRATVIDSEEYFFTCSRYIEQNPVRAGLCASPGAFRWSSYRHNALGCPNSLITQSELYRRLGRSPAERQAAYSSICLAAVSEDALNAIRTATAKAWALGGHAFQRQIEQLAGRRPHPIKTGRPRKTRV